MIVKPITFVVVAIIIVAALWLFFKPQRPELQAPVRAKTLRESMHVWQ